jgi:predicted phosphodiesterase
LVSGNHDSRAAKALSDLPNARSAKQIFRSDLIARIADGEELDVSGRVIKVHEFANVIYQQPESWWVQIGKTIFAHPSGYKQGPAGTVTKLDEVFSNRFGTSTYDSLVIGHTHKVNKLILNNRMLIEQGSFSARQDYEHKSNMIFRHAMNGFAVIIQDDKGDTDFNKSQVFYLGSELPPKKPIL